MILCKYSELRRYAAVLLHLDAALECVAKVCAEGLKEGRREFEGGYLSVQTGRTAPLADGRYETHHRYADVQYMVRGEEETAYLSMEDLAPATEYDAEKDIQFFHSVGAQPTVAHVPAGMCYVVFSEDGHMPCRCVGEAKDYQKIVIKLRMDSPKA